MSAIIEIRSLSKSFRITRTRHPYLTARESLAAVFAGGKAATREIWALRDINLSVNAGESLGIIGRNGAGKSTLLKILSKITYPTSGKVIVRGRLSSLLEVGTGFHPELTGRENIYLNGSILGLTKKEINAGFDDIVDFSGIGPFLETPLKRYSSGMQLRLAFSVAAHLNAEIIVVDEVLAVGDNEFQKKCLSKMDEVTKSGRTVLFVSHNMNAVSELCTRVIHLKNGMVEDTGSASGVIDRYLKTSARHNEKEKRYAEDAPGDHITRIRHVRLIDMNGQPVKDVLLHERIGIEVGIEVLQEGYAPQVNIDLWSIKGEYVAPFVQPSSISATSKGGHTIIMWIPGNFLNNLVYTVGVGIKSFTSTPYINHGYDKEALLFEVMETSAESVTRNGYKGSFGGVVRPLFKWEKRI